MTILIRFFYYKLITIESLISLRRKKYLIIILNNSKFQIAVTGMLSSERVYQLPFYVATLRGPLFCKSSLNSSVGESKSSFPTTITNFVIRWRRTWVKPEIFLSTTWSVTARKSFLSSTSILKILAIGYWFL